MSLLKILPGDIEPPKGKQRECVMLGLSRSNEPSGSHREKKAVCAQEPSNDNLYEDINNNFVQNKHPNSYIYILQVDQPFPPRHY